MNRRRARDRLGDADPVRLEDAPSAQSPQGRATFEQIVHTPPEPSGPSRWSGRRRLALVLVPVVLTAGIAAGYRWLRTPSEPLVVACYERADLGAQRAVVPASARNDAHACNFLWRSGGLFASEHRSVVPPLVACVLPSGAVGVFPVARGGDPCDALGLAHVGTRGEGSAENAAIVRMQDEVVDQLLDRCIDAARARAIVQAALGREQLRGWRVVVSAPFTPSEPCASLAFDVADRTVLIAPVRDSRSP